MLPVSIKDPKGLLLNELSQIGNYDPFVSAPIYTVNKVEDLDGHPELGVAPGSYALVGNDSDGWKLEQLDISNPDKIIPIGEKAYSSYKVNFTNDLLDGQYTLVITDDAGNKVIGNENQKFNIEKIVPEMSILLLNEGLDTGSSGEDRRTTERKPDFSFSSETGSRVFIEKVIETDSNSSGPNKVFSLTENQLGNSNAGSFVILENESKYILKKVIADTETVSTNDYKLLENSDDFLEINRDSDNGLKITNFLSSQRVANYFNIEKTSSDSTDKIEPFLLGQDSEDTSVGSYTNNIGQVLKVYQLTDQQLTNSQSVLPILLRQQKMIIFLQKRS